MENEITDPTEEETAAGYRRGDIRTTRGVQATRPGVQAEKNGAAIAGLTLACSAWAVGVMGLVLAGARASETTNPFESIGTFAGVFIVFGVAAFICYILGWVYSGIGLNQANRLPNRTGLATAIVGMCISGAPVLVLMLGAIG